MMYEFDKNNVRFISYNENIDTSNSMSKMLMYVIGICAEIERDNTSENVKLAKRQEFENGKVTAKKVLGYDLINKQLVINKKEAAATVGCRRFFLMLSNEKFYIQNDCLR